MSENCKVKKGGYPDYRKGLIAMRSWLVGKNYQLSLAAMSLARGVHTGKRKDGVTPEFQHQLGVTYYLRTVHQLLMFPDVTIAAGFLHDSVEDGFIRIEDVASLNSVETQKAVAALNKRGISTARYYTNIANNAVASIVKAADRMHNHQSMVDVFTIDKQRMYVLETTKYVLPMLKRAQEKFIMQHEAYENARHILKCQVDLIVRINGW